MVDINGELDLGDENYLIFPFYVQLFPIGINQTMPKKSTYSKKEGIEVRQLRLMLDTLCEHWTEIRKETSPI
jgi:hypothetical protein